MKLSIAWAVWNLTAFCVLANGAIMPVNADAQSPASAVTDGPHYKVDPFWPKQLPNNWIMGQVAGLAIDSQDHVWVLQRPLSSTFDELFADKKQAICCNQTPAVLEFDADGNLLQSWGGPGFVPDWPKKEHGITVDKKGNVWVGGNGPGDRQVLKFTADGHFLMEIGHPSTAPKNNLDTTILGAPSGIEVDDAAHEVYIADGYMNNRVVVYDSETGKFKRGWGAYGIELSKVTNVVAVPPEGFAVPPPYDPARPPSPQFNNPVHCAHISVDGLVYVCDRTNNRIQIFTKQGKFMKEFIVRPETQGIGSVWTLDFSKDPKQNYLLVGDGTNNVIWILRREDGKEVSSFGHAGRNVGQFHWVHSAVMDSKGTYYTGEVDTGKRIQKFVLEHADSPR